MAQMLQQAVGMQSLVSMMGADVPLRAPFLLMRWRKEQTNGKDAGVNPIPIRVITPYKRTDDQVAKDTDNKRGEAPGADSKSSELT